MTVQEIAESLSEDELEIFNLLQEWHKSIFLTHRSRAELAKKINAKLPILPFQGQPETRMRRLWKAIDFLFLQSSKLSYNQILKKRFG